MPISRDTATDIALAYREIEIAEELLEKVTKEVSRGTAPDIRDAFGRQVAGLELGVPSTGGGRRLFNVPWNLAEPIIKAHIATQRAAIEILTEKAKAEISTAITTSLRDEEAKP